MPRKIFISFLGSTNYSACHYVKDNYKSKNVRYIQEATLEYFETEKWDNDSKAFILVTDGEKGSYHKNWKDDGQEVYKTKETIVQSGLNTELSKLNLPFEVIDKHIKDGISEEEIWEIFELVYNLLNENDELYIDITHGFRYLPMLSIVLANYGKLLKNISVKSITYGNYESRNTKTNEAPIIDITSFSQLQDWTNAANLFVNHGAINMLTNLIDDIELTKNLNSFSNIHSTARAKELYSGDIATDLSLQINSIEQDLPPFNPIKKKIVKKLEEYSKGDIINNGLAAVKYCIDFGLTQQGITILSEFIITYVLLAINEDWEKESNRSAVSGCLNINKIDKYDFSILESKLSKSVFEGKIESSIKDKLQEEEKTIVRKVFGLQYKNKLSNKVYKKLSQGTRNDINHAGIRQEPKSSEYLIDRLNKYYEMTLSIIK